jgi:hypothetical protein
MGIRYVLPFLLCMYIFGSLPLRWVQVLFIINTWTYYNRNAFKIIVFYLITWCMALSHYLSLGGECITCNFAENQKHAYGHFFIMIVYSKTNETEFLFLGNSWVGGGGGGWGSLVSEITTVLCVSLKKKKELLLNWNTSFIGYLFCWSFGVESMILWQVVDWSLVPVSLKSWVRIGATSSDRIPLQLKLTLIYI